MPSQNTSKTSPPSGQLIALETSGRQGSVAVMEVDAPLPLLERGQGRDEKPGHPTCLTRELPPQERSAQTLAPTIQQLLAEIGWEAPSLGCIAIATGPGSFTGLRVGVTTAKTLAYVAGAALVAVNTLDALAEPSWLDEAPLWSVLDAQRSEVFAARYEGPLTKETLVERLTQAEFFAKLKEGDRVVAPHAAILSQRCEREGVTWTTAQPMADAVARLGAARWQAGQLSDPFQLAPQYHRISAAEENLRRQ